ncbi:hypothetical protein [Saliphagus infecundisoli]|uniref:Uncharacterized protein n=1 Tax=Saliphagus infecundisoli TaxID=1849069 RepID=A0ABD5QDB2_9EURY|nr:hypothetical protein [Saliphagus infecundisoli]
MQPADRMARRLVASESPGTDREDDRRRDDRDATDGHVPSLPDRP